MGDRQFDIASSEYEQLGLVVNPFTLPLKREGMEDSHQLVCHAEAARLYVALREESRAEKSRPIWISKFENLPDYYTRVSLAEALSLLPVSPAMNVLVAYVPFASMRQGRIRSTLDAVAERLAGESFGLTCAHFAAEALGQPDEGLLSEAGLSGDVAAEVAASFSDHPEAAAGEFFGEEMTVREGAMEAEQLIMESTKRLGDLEVDPEASDEVDEEPEGDRPLVVAEPLDVGEDDDLAPSEMTEEESAALLAQAVRSYLIAYARAHVSPVVAR
ncbi:MAG: hypothetical protein U1E22_01880, partial [Coriobacteriia bacterium]|nr:hypothetical protein [Coriobacteriia bacterium]